MEISFGGITWVCSAFAAVISLANAPTRATGLGKATFNGFGFASIASFVATSPSWHPFAGMSHDQKLFVSTGAVIALIILVILTFNAVRLILSVVFYPIIDFRRAFACRKKDPKLCVELRIAGLVGCLCLAIIGSALFVWDFAPLARGASMAPAIIGYTAGWKWSAEIGFKLQGLKPV